MIDPKDLASVRDIAKHFGVLPQTVISWSKRHKAFPKPVTVLASGAVYSMKSVITYRKNHVGPIQYPSHMNTPLKIYVAGPFSGDNDERIQFNVTTAVHTSMMLAVRGHNPFIPHLYYHMDKYMKKFGYEFDYERWMEMDDAWLKVSDAIYFIGRSPGADRELDLSKERGIKVFSSIDDVPDLRVKST